MHPLSKTIRDARENRRLTQKQLSEAIGCHPSFITKIETLENTGSLPSHDLTRAIANTLALDPEILWEQVETARDLMLHRRLRSRGDAVAENIRRRGAPLVSNSTALTEPLREAVANLSDNPDVQKAVLTALPHLVRAMEDPEMRQIVDSALRGWAKLADKELKQKTK